MDNTNNSLKAAEAECAARAVAPRISLADIEAAIVYVNYISGADIASAGEGCTRGPVHTAVKAFSNLETLTVCLVVTRTGFSIIGKSAPASPENFDQALGRKLAYEDCIRQLWPLMGFALREKLHEAGA